MHPFMLPALIWVNFNNNHGKTAEVMPKKTTGLEGSNANKHLSPLKQQDHPASDAKNQLMMISDDMNAEDG